MPLPRLFVAVMIVLNVCAALAYFSQKEWKQGGFWLCCAAANYCITF